MKVNYLNRDILQNPFNDFLINSGFNSSGHILSSKLKKYKKTEKGIYHLGKDTKVSVDTILNKGRFIEFSDLVLIHDNQEYYSRLFEYRGKLYTVFPTLNDEFYEYEDYLNEWLFDLNKEQYQEYKEGNLSVPSKILKLKPKSIYIVYNVIYTPIAEDCHDYFENDIFILRPYYWGDSVEIADKPNFVYKPKNIEVHWYKHPLRDAYSNKKISNKVFLEILKECEQSVKR